MVGLYQLSGRVMNIHIVGICGVAMGTLACMLRDCGHILSGSDSGIYPPMSTLLEKAGIAVYTGFSPENVGSPDIAVIGNAVSRGNPEVEYILNNNIPYRSFAAMIREFFLEGREVVGVCGTHGKSTTAALLSFILDYAGEDPSFFVGAVLSNYGANYRLGKGRHFVIEADEYDSAFFEKYPKFISYRPRHLVMTSLEFDHADIYGSLAEIKKWFKWLVNVIPSEGKIVYSGQDHNLEDVASAAVGPVYSYGNSSADFEITFQGFEGMWSLLEMQTRSHGRLQLRTTLFGEYNYSNIAAAVGMALQMGIRPELAAQAVSEFKGVRRRQEVIFHDEYLTVLEDFAHHPTAIKAVMSAVAKRYPESEITAVYEPRSATSRRKVFQNDLPSSFADAARVILKTPYGINSIPEDERLDIEKVASDINSMGIEASIYDDINPIIDSLTTLNSSRVKSVYLIMSNGGFDGIYDRLKERLSLSRSVEGIPCGS